MFGWGKKNSVEKRTLPTVRFDTSRITDKILDDLWNTIHEYEDLPYGQEQAVYDASYEMLEGGFDLSILSEALVGMGVAKGRASAISQNLGGRALCLMNVEQYLELGHTESEWLYSGAPCYSGIPTDYDIARDRAHQLANGKPYPTALGALINGKRTYPGLDLDCKCVFGPHLSSLGAHPTK